MMKMMFLIEKMVLMVSDALKYVSSLSERSITACLGFQQNKYEHKSKSQKVKPKGPNS